MALEQAINVREGPTCSSTFSVVLHEEAVGAVHWDAMAEQAVHSDAMAEQDRGVSLGDWWAGATGSFNKSFEQVISTLRDPSTNPVPKPEKKKDDDTPKKKVVDKKMKVCTGFSGGKGGG